MTPLGMIETARAPLWPLLWKPADGRREKAADVRISVGYEKVPEPSLFQTVFVVFAAKFGPPARPSPCERGAVAGDAAPPPEKSAIVLAVHVIPPSARRTSKGKNAPSLLAR